AHRAALHDRPQHPARGRRGDPVHGGCAAARIDPGGDPAGGEVRHTGEPALRERRARRAHAADRSRGGRRPVGGTPLNLLVVNWPDRENPRSGGAEIHLHEIFGRLAARGHRVTLLVSGFDNAPATTQLDGMEVHRTGSRNTFSLAAPRYYRRTLANRPFDLVIEDLNKVPLFMPFWVKRPLVLLVHHLFGTTAFQEASFPFAAATWLLEKPLARVYGEVAIEAVSESAAG